MEKCTNEIIRERESNEQSGAPTNTESTPQCGWEHRIIAVPHLKYQKDANNFFEGFST